jgi:hypothetical protein
MMRNHKNVYQNIIDYEVTKTDMKTAETNYQTSLNTYTTKVLNGSVTFAQQLLLLQDVNDKKVIYDGYLVCINQWG